MTAFYLVETLCHTRGGEGTPYVGRYVMLGYTRVVLRNFLYFFREMGTFF